MFCMLKATHTEDLCAFCYLSNIDIFQQTVNVHDKIRSTSSFSKLVPCNV